MDYEQFLEEIKNRIHFTSINPARNYKEEGSFFIVAKTYVGGMVGGNCWDDSKPVFQSSDDKQEELTSLDVIFEIFYPEITFLNYRIFTNKNVKETSNTEYEYYGNTSEYKIKYCNLKDVYNFLEEKGAFDRWTAGRGQDKTGKSTRSPKRKKATVR